MHDTQGHVELEQREIEVVPTDEPAARPRWREVFWRATVRDPTLSSASQAGLVNNLNDGIA